MLRAGAAQVDITPEPGAWLSGYSGRTQPAAGVHDPLFARAVFLESDGQRVALGVADVIGLDEELVRRVREAVVRAAGLHPSHVMLAATHTHSGPSIMRAGMLAIQRRDRMPPDARVVDRVAAGMTQAIVAAVRNAQPALVGAGSATGSIGVNRRKRGPDGRIRLEPNPGGPVDRQVRVLRVHGGPSGICIMLNHACHGVVLGPDSLLYSADWLGAAAGAVQQATGAMVGMVTNGAGADVNPVERGDFDAAERQGRAIARIGLDLLGHIQFLPEVQIEAASRTLALPTRSLTSEEGAQVLERIRADFERARQEGDLPAIHAHEFRLPWAEAMVELAAGGARPEPVAAEIQAIALGDIALLGLPGEVFVEIGMNIAAASPFRHTFIIGYANRSVGYIPTRQAFAEGGYEVEAAHCHYGFPPFTPEVQGLVEGAALELLKSLR